MAVDIRQISPDAMYSVAEAARVLELSEQTIRSYLNDGTVKGNKNKKGRWKITGREIVRYVTGKS